MQKSIVPRKHVLALTITSLFAAGPSFAQTAPAPSENAATVVVTGTRVANRTALDTASPVDIISADTLKNTGSTELNQALSIALPSLNFPRPSLTDGTDTIRPATLRGMGPDQTLVLVNSKRRHASSLVNVNGSIGRGSAAVDMNTIPTAIIKSIEVLRDGAAAQYGSDAISGVINIRLRNNRDGGEATLSYGARNSEYDLIPAPPPAGATWTSPTTRKRKDGETTTFSVWKGLPWGETGNVTIAAEYKKQNTTERAGYDTRQQYAKLADGSYDPRELTINRFSAWSGEPGLDQSTIFVNASNPLDGGMKLYGWTSYQRRDALSAGTFRRPQETTNFTGIWPDGFLPKISPVVDDVSATGGVTWNLGDWDMDTSLGYGSNRMHFFIKDSLNRSLGAASKTSFDSGGFEYDQTVFNITGVKGVTMGGFESPLNVALGAEVRKEGYGIFAGEPDSYRNGGVTLPGGAPAASGAQVFPGFRPTDEGRFTRTAVGVFADFEANVTKQFLASVAIRGEHYSDFGNSLAGKLSLRYDITPNFALRGAAQNGFRAPSPQQQQFTTTSTNFINGIPFEITTFRPGHPVAVALGAKPLEAEKSLNLSLGAVMRVDSLSVTVDAYQIKIDNRIALSETLNSTAVQNYLISQGITGVGGARFFINGIDTTTKGVDIVASLPWNAGAAGKFDFTVAANATKTDVTKIPTTSQVSALNPAPVLFAGNNQRILEKGQPKNKINASVSWKLGAMGATLRATRYGEVLAPNVNQALDFLMPPATVFDIEGRYAVSKALNLALGVDNMFDKYPPVLPGATLNTTSSTPFSTFAPYGRSGRYIYARASYAF
jgi:iron complex outermembrane receptor protein